MWEKIKNVAVISLATLGVLFIIIMLIPDDDDSKVTADTQQVEASVEDDSQEDDASEGFFEEADEEDEDSEDEDASEDESEEASVEEEPEDEGNVIEISIPESEISSRKLKFKTVTLDNKKVSQKIFSDYDITIVHLWGTFCQPCISEMGDYARLYKELPDNVNLIGIVSDVYDGIDSNVSRANEILEDAGAEFTNLRTSDDLYDIVGEFQYVPSSFFVDSKGRVIGELMDGAFCNDTVSRLEGYMK
ncbi:MAG: TlpA family protein disulfide reductase [Lachnospiraceae bacterium]|nr:TlpA family protein disulfide reductase [Lachnospiraceae bacterium]